MSYISCNNDTRQRYTLPKGDQKKNMNHVTHHLSSTDISIFHWKPANFAKPRNTDIDCIWTHNF